LRMDASRIERHASLTSLGMDSLMSLELRNRLEGSLGLRMSTTLIFTYPNLASLAEYLFQQIAPKVPQEKDPFAAQHSAELNASQGPVAEPLTDDELLAALDESMQGLNLESIS